MAYYMMDFGEVRHLQISLFALLAVAFDQHEF